MGASRWNNRVFRMKECEVLRILKQRPPVHIRTLVDIIILREGQWLSLSHSRPIQEKVFPSSSNCVIAQPISLKLPHCLPDFDPQTRTVRIQKTEMVGSSSEVEDSRMGIQDSGSNATGFLYVDALFLDSGFADAHNSFDPDIWCEKRSYRHCGCPRITRNYSYQAVKIGND